MLKQSFTDHAPESYPPWLDRNIDRYDPIFRSWRMRDSMPPTARSLMSLKCWDERCLHYIYGFYNQGDRDNHAREHVAPSKRDSGLSVGNAPLAPFSDFSSSRLFSSDYSRRHSSIQLPKPMTTTQLPPLSTTSQSRERRDSLLSYSFVNDNQGHGRGSIDSEVDPLLPPLKRSRVGQSRLESIEELRLLREVGPCLRCKVLNKPVRPYPIRRCAILISYTW
jgi:hypothetical protein